jgi:hypothetical protein
MRLFAAVLVVACSVAFAVASPQDEKKKKDSERLMVVEGCVNGSTLVAHHFDLGRGNVSAPYDHFKLRGNKDLMKVLTKDLRGHLVEVTGIMDDPAQKQGVGKTIGVGSKTTVYVKDRDVSNSPDPATDPVITVDSFKDIDSHCSSGQ